MRNTAIIFSLLLGVTPAQAAATLDVAPTMLDLKPGEAGLFYVTNHGAGPVTIQIEALDWSQKDNGDVLVPSQSLLTSPPLARILPGVRQSVRVLAQPAGDGRERAYRLLVSELPASNTAGEGVKVLLRFSVPVFVNRQADARPHLVWTRDGGGFLTVSNAGSQAVKLADLLFNGAAPGGQTAALVYVLAGARHRFTVPDGRLRLSGHDVLSGMAFAADLP